jgi:Ca2+/H+ antiporter, TMEM165/GDT1 family
MDVLLTSLLSTMLAEMGDRTQILVAVLAIRFGNNRAIIWGLIAATFVNCAISAVGGSMIDQWISSDAVTMFIGLSYFLAGIGMLLWRRPVDQLSDWKIGAFWTAFAGVAILQLGDKSQFIIAGQAARTVFWPYAAIGGALGIIAACIPAILLRERLAAILPMHGIRRGAGIVFVAIGLVLAMRAKGLMG